METRKKIELSPIEVTAYWWTNSIKEKVREIIIHNSRDYNENLFINIFYGYTEVDWRNMYLALAKDIAHDVECLDTTQGNCFSQDTCIGGHDRLNEELAQITHKFIPDIRLAGFGVKDSVIYTTPSKASVWYKSCGERVLPTMYDESYILTGNQKKLDFYNTLISTIAIIEQKDKYFNSVPVLRERFCQEYIRLSDEDEKAEDITQWFNVCFDKADDKGLIHGRHFDRKYFPSFRNIDFVGLNPYLPLANHYADIILEPVKNNNENKSGKILKKHDKNN